MYILQFDGMLRSSSDGWPAHLGLLGYGWLIKRNDVEIAYGFGIFVRKCLAGSNVAEYLALIEVLEALADLRIKHDAVEIRGDAKCVIDQMIGQAGVSSPLTMKLNRHTQNLASRFTALTWVWVPRRENRHADSLSRRSFRNLRYSPYQDQEINQSGLPSFYSGRLVPLVDLRVHHPMMQVKFI